MFATGNMLNLSYEKNAVEKGGTLKKYLLIMISAHDILIFLVLIPTKRGI